MIKIYTGGRTAKTWRKLALLGLLSLATGAAYAQSLNYNAFGATNLAGTYTDLGAGATAIATANTDDANSAATPIGFSFSFNGTAFTDFVLNTNGYLALGTTVPAAPYFPTSSTTTTGGPLNDITQSNLLLPFNTDLESAPAAPAEYSYAVSGTAPDRVCTIQWKGVSDKSATATPAKQYFSLDFQVKLYETSNRVEFVYNTATATANTDAFKSAVVGIKGAGTTEGQLVLATKGSTSPWANTAFITTTYVAAQANAHNFRRTVGPDAGRTYRFDVAKANDVSVQTIYSLGKLPIPLAVPHVIRAFVRNVGTAAVANSTYTLTVTGANTFTSTRTVASIPAGSTGAGTLSFDPFTPTNPGTNTITVKATDDDNNTNNTSTFTQLVNTTTFAYAQPGLAPTVNGEIGFNTGGGILGVKYTTNAARSVTGVTVRLGTGNEIVGNKLYGVVLTAAGAIIARSLDYTVVAADLNKDKTFTLNAFVPAGSFIAGVAQTANATVGYFPVASQGYEIPSRTDAYFSIPLAGGTPADAANSNLGALMIEAVTDVAPTCPPVTGASVASVTFNSATISFTGPANGTSYSLIYGPRGFNPASAGTTVAATTSPFTITGLTPSTNYDVYIRANCSATDQSTLVGPLPFATTCVPPIVSAFPYAENFDGVAVGALPCGITVANINNDASTWSVVSTGTPASAPNHMRYTFSIDNAANDWFFTPALFLRAGTTYQLGFKYKAGLSSFPEGLEVKYGSATTPTGQTNLLWRNIAISNTAYATTVAGTADGQVQAITPTATGNYYIGFHAISAANAFYLYVDDISLTASVITSSSAALQRAINVYPNPTADQLTISVSGAKAKDGLRVEITNMLGQRVHTATIRDNATNQLDVSNLASGIYTVKVLNGNEYSTSKISVQH